MTSKIYETRVGSLQVTKRDGWIATRFLDDFNLEKFKELFPDSGINEWSYKWNIWGSNPQKELKERLKLLL